MAWPEGTGGHYFRTLTPKKFFEEVTLYINRKLGRVVRECKRIPEGRKLFKRKKKFTEEEIKYRSDVGRQRKLFREKKVKSGSKRVTRTHRAILRAKTKRKMSSIRLFSFDIFIQQQLIKTSNTDIILPLAF